MAPRGEYPVESLAQGDRAVEGSSALARASVGLVQEAPDVCVGDETGMTAPPHQIPIASQPVGGVFTGMPVGGVGEV